MIFSIFGFKILQKLTITVGFRLIFSLGMMRNLKYLDSRIP